MDVNKRSGASIGVPLHMVWSLKGRHKSHSCAICQLDRSCRRRSEKRSAHAVIAIMSRWNDRGRLPQYNNIGRDSGDRAGRNPKSEKLEFCLMIIEAHVGQPRIRGYMSLPKCTSVRGTKVKVELEERRK